MRKSVLVLTLAALLAATLPAMAELQNVTVGGQIHIRGNYINNQVLLVPGLRYNPLQTLGRPIGGPFHPAVASVLSWDGDADDFTEVEQRTRLNINADFTDNVSAFIEFDSYDIWGEDFRSKAYLTGVDTRAASQDDVEIYQSYVQAKELWGTPLSVKIGRQELSFGSQWLIGPRDFAFVFTGLSFDAIRLTYAADDFTVDAWASKLTESFTDFGKGDIDFYGLYGSYKGVENHTFDLYYLLLRDDTAMPRHYDDTLLHTVGARAAGKCGALDYDAEVAYQFGQADSLGVIVGDRDADWDNLGAKLDVGYSFDCAWHPRVFVGGRYYGGEDNRDISFWEWLNPFDRPDASVSFNRLFSNEIANGYVDLLNDLSNAWWARLGVMAAPTEKLHGILALTYIESLEAFDRPVAGIFSWWTRENDKDLGVEAILFMEYCYSKDLTFEAGWSHLFTGDGLGKGNYSSWNGTIFNGGSDDDDADYVYGGCKISF